jgi:hypothetical protein
MSIGTPTLLENEWGEIYATRDNGSNNMVYPAEGSMGAGTPPKDASGYPTAIAVVAGLVSSVSQPESGGPV